MKFTDIYDPTPGATHKQFWFRPGGAFLFNESGPKERWYKMLPRLGKLKRWWRIYTVALEDDSVVIRYIRKGKKQAFIVYTAKSDQLVKVHSEAGKPPWFRKEKGDGDRDK